MNRHLSIVERLKLLVVVIYQDDVMAQVGKARAGDQSDVS